MAEQIPFPEHLVKYWDIARGLGEVVFHEVFRMPHQLASHGNHEPDFVVDAVDDFDRSDWTPVQQRAADWGDRA